MNMQPEALPTLTAKQTGFVNAMLAGKTATDAYRETYNCENMSHRAIWVEASRLRRSPKVTLWLRHFQRMGQDAARLSLETHLAELARARELAIAHRQISAGVQAEHFRGKAAGLYEAGVSISGGPSDAELLKAIEELMGKETAETIGNAMGCMATSI